MPDIRLAVSLDDRHAVFGLRYAIYIEEMGRSMKNADHAAKLLIDPLDVSEAILLAAWHDGEVVGTARANYLRTCDAGDYESFYGINSLSSEERAVTSVSTRIMVRAEFRRTTLAVRLASALYRHGLRDGIQTDFCDCNDHLLPYFSGLGYKPFRKEVFHAEYGSVTVMRLDLHDRQHLEAVRSPFRKVLRAYQGTEGNSPETT